MKVKLVLMAPVGLIVALVANISSESTRVGRAESSGNEVVLFDTEYVKIKMENGSIVREHKHQLPPQDRKIVTVKGDKVRDDSRRTGCEFAGEVRFEENDVEPGFTFISREISFNPSACAMKFEEAIVSDAWLAVEDAGERSGSVFD